MVAKVSAMNVLRETIALFKYKIRLIGGGFVLMSLLSLPLYWQLGDINPEEMTSDQALLLVAALLPFFILGTSIQISIFHNFIRTLRGETPSLLPQGIVGKFFKTLWKEFLLGLALIIPGVVVELVLILGFVAVLPESEPSTFLLIMMTAVSFLGLVLGFAVLAVRWGFCIPAVAVGETSSFKLSWRMTKGHTLGLVAFTIPPLLIQTIMQLIADPAQADGPINFLAPSMLLGTAITGLAYWFTYTAFCVWYVRLLERYEMMIAEGKTPTPTDGNAGVE